MNLFPFETYVYYNFFEKAISHSFENKKAKTDEKINTGNIYPNAHYIFLIDFNTNVNKKTLIRCLVKITR